MSRKRIIVVNAIAVVLFVAIVALELLAPFAYFRARNFLQDAIARAGRKTPPNPDLVFLAIDAEATRAEAEEDVDEIFGLGDRDSIESRGLHAMKRQWPWSREVYALVLERLMQAGAKLVMFDLTFPTPMLGDEPFRSALDTYRDRVIIGSNFVSAEQVNIAGTRIADTQPSETLIPSTKPRDDRVAYTNFWPDEDDVVRRGHYQITSEEVNGIPPVTNSERFLSMAARALTKLGLAEHVPPNTAGHCFRYTAPPRKGFPPRSIIELFDPPNWKHRYQSGEFFRDKIVLVGAEGNWQHDEHPTPFGSMPGPELHLNALNAAMHKEFIRELSPRSVLLVVLAAAAIALALSLGIRSPWVRLFLLLMVDCAAGSAGLFAFNRFNLDVPCLPFLLELNAVVLLGLVSDFTSERVEKKRIRRTLERYVSNNVVRELLDKPRAFEQSLGGVLKPATILFSDIRGYSTVSARTDPQTLVTQLNEYLSAMVECVFRYGGTLDKFIGDAVMAVWGNVQSEGVRNDAANAVRAALAMREELARLNAGWRIRGMAELRVGIAINHGEVVVGNIGSPRRMEFTVIGDAVNVSWKLQELTKQAGRDLVVSKSVAALVMEHFELQQLDTFKIAGFAEPFEISAVTQAIALGQERELVACDSRDRVSV